MLLLLPIIVLAIVPAYGYVDPGTGSYLLQLLIGSVLGAAFLLRRFRSQVADFFKRLFRKKDG